ncbi:MAG TPA: GAF domain-containing protein [Candidatus Acidoferrales bacterium]|nr:GAF domain-containing protein [Candidatus Acidoferrales bacterium]
MPDDAALIELATLYYSCRDTDALLRTFATRMGHALDAGAVLVWLPQDGQGLHCRARWLEPGLRIEAGEEPADAGPLLEAMESREPVKRGAGQLDPGELAHLSEPYRQRVRAALYVPLPGARASLGVAEFLNPRSGEFDLPFARQAARITGLALERQQEQESERQGQLVTVQRLTELYDLSRVFSSTLELGDLLPVIAEKLRDFLGARAANLWLVEGKTRELRFAAQAGEDPTTEPGMRCALGEGPLGVAADRGEPRRIENAADEESLLERRERAPEFALGSLLIAPLRMNEQVLGVAEVVNKSGGAAFTEEELFFLTTIGEQAAISIHNAQLLEAERRVHQLDALLQISREITSTLNLDHVLAAVVQHAASVVPFDRCAIGYFDRGRFVLGAVSGETEIPQTDEMSELRRLLESIATSEEPVSANRGAGGWKSQAPGGAERLEGFLERHGYNGFYALPLRDEQGALGTLALVSSEADFLSHSQRETLAILASQATVAVRNAQLYQQVPLSGLLRPLAKRRQKLRSAPRGRWVDAATNISAVVLLLVLVPWKLRIRAGSQVVPAERRLVTSEVAGLVERVYVREGSRVEPGQVLATIDDTDDRLHLVQAQTQLALAQRALSEAEFRGDTGASSQARLSVQEYSAETNLYGSRLARAELRSPIAGVVVTPRVEERVGERLQPGDRFCEVVEQRRMAVQMRVPESDIGELRPNAAVALKLNSFPTVTFHGVVEYIGAQTASAGGQEFFLVRALFENTGEQARDGMVGQSKITAAGGYFGSGWYSTGYVLLRVPARWVWERLWAWWP